MAKVSISEEEYFPVYELGTHETPGWEWLDRYEVPDELIERHTRLLKEWNECQREIGRIKRETDNGSKKQQ